MRTRITLADVALGTLMAGGGYALLYASLWLAVMVGQGVR